jgi:hypothetical protein
MSTNRGYIKPLLQRSGRPTLRTKWHNYYYLIAKIDGCHGSRAVLMEIPYNNWLNASPSKKTNIILELYKEYLWLNPFYIQVQRFTSNGEILTVEYTIALSSIAQEITKKERRNTVIQEAIDKHLF